MALRLQRIFFWPLSCNSLHPGARGTAPVARDPVQRQGKTLTSRLHSLTGRWFSSQLPGGRSWPGPELMIQCVWDGAWECVFLMSSQVMLMPLVPGPHFENHWSRPALSNRNVTLATCVIWNFPVAMLKKIEKKRMKLFNHITTMILFQNIINIKITNEIHYIHFFFFFCTKSSSSRMYFSLSAHLSSD